MPKLNVKSNKPEVFIGIDPSAIGGTTGGAIAVTTNGELETFNLTGTETDVVNFLMEKTAGKTCYAVLEKVHAMPKQGVSSTFKFGTGYGFIRGFLTALRVPFVEVEPKKWQSFFDIKGGKDVSKTQHKNNLKSKAQHLYPKRKITLKDADAILLVTYISKIYGNESRSISG